MHMSDMIFVAGLLIHTHHGVMAQEEQGGPPFAIAPERAIALAPAASSDKLVDTVSYASIVETATRAFTANSYRLVEAAAGVVADALLGAFARVISVKVTVHKPH